VNGIRNKFTNNDLNILLKLSINIFLVIYFFCWYTGPLQIWLTVSKFDRDLNIIEGLLTGSIDETINADSIRPEEFRRDSNTDCL